MTPAHPRGHLMDASKLPPLPEPVSSMTLAAWGPKPDYYTADQMHAYALSALASLPAGEPVAACTIRLSDADWNPYELLSIVRHSVSEPVLRDRVDECLQQQARCQTLTTPTAEAARGEGGVAEWQFQDRDGKWHCFHNEQHRANTVADGTWPIRALYTRSTPPAPLAGQGGEAMQWDDVAHRVRTAFRLAVDEGGTIGEAHAAMQAEFERLTTPPAASTQGEGVLIPRDPPTELLEAMCVAYEASPCHDLMGPMEDAYAALVRAAPSPAAAGGENGNG